MILKPPPIGKVSLSPVILLPAGKDAIVDSLPILSVRFNFLVSRFDAERIQFKRNSVNFQFKYCIARN